MQKAIFQVFFLVFLVVVVVVMPLMWYQNEVKTWPQVVGHVTKLERRNWQSFYVNWNYMYSGERLTGRMRMDTFGFLMPKVGDEIHLKIQHDYPKN